MKIMISIPDELLVKFDFYVKKQYKTRSGLIQDIIYEYCKNQKQKIDESNKNTTN